MAQNKNSALLQAYCSQAMLPQISALRKSAGNILRRKNVEDIHDIRVASRRVRTCLSIFSDFMPSKKRKTWVQDIRSITQSYGHIRDLDVQIELLTSLLKKPEHKSHIAGMRRMRLRLRQKKAKDESKTKALTSEILESPALLEMQAWAESKAADYDFKDTQSIILFQTAYSQIQSRLDEFLFFEVFIFDPERISELHQMRIAAKHLRYALEIFSDLYSGKIDFALDISRKIQQTLGEIHDADMWASTLPKFLIKEKDRFAHFYGYSSLFNHLKPGVEFLMSNRKFERDHLYKQFINDWKRWKIKETWLNLRKVTFLTSLEQQNLRGLSDETSESGEIQNHDSQ